MSDVADFTGISAGSVTEVATGSVECTFSGTAGRYNGEVTVPALPVTTRSVLVLATVTALSPGPTGDFTGVSVTGLVSGVAWPGGTPNLSTAGSPLVEVGSAIAPQYFPAYGLVDSSVQVEFTFAQDTTVDYWVLAMPDPDILGSPQVPVSVAISTLNTAPGGHANPLYVAPVPDPASGGGPVADGVFSLGFSAGQTQVIVPPAPFNTLYQLDRIMSLDHTVTGVTIELSDAVTGSLILEWNPPVTNGQTGPFQVPAYKTANGIKLGVLNQAGTARGCYHAYEVLV